ncbi:hypothetical protein SporoP37_09820 [Sporosarcina sp. P37]|uniref:glycosyl hydrolase family 18 protein n=1 Tax=unclassified Sporosarcina TaxID=2647733 RepID=UPI000A17B492|nr:MULTISPECIES: glycosyl hydrolase family 18 protein [unclassified Sporosarcina]ARK24930.1 hypothetical protein SporoP37_09820 [Sporosarcina sp. P37]PID18070.1 glycosyl hydrolase [Sporosarcina sp. P35]
MKTKNKMAHIVITCLLLSGCRGQEHEQQMDVAELKSLELSAWVTEWQWQSGMEDLKQVQGLDRTQVFAAYFDSDDQLYFSDKMHEAIAAMQELSRKRKIPLDLTIVNDQFLPDNTVVHKDADLIARLVGSSASRKAHIDTILHYISKYQFDGLEIDYENVNTEDLPNLIQFYKELNQALETHGKTLRVILEPNLRVEDYQFPAGPVYVMMAYNLHGGHSDPGPKANEEFIRNVAKKMSALPGEPIMAFSAGGFKWQHGKDHTATLTEIEAEELARKSHEKPVRDPASGGMYFDYKEKNGEKFTVWYADRQTLHQWMKIAAEEGNTKVSLWRMGGIETSTLEFLNKAIR